MKLTMRAIFATLGTLTAASTAQAQFFYSPPPALMGQPSYHLYSVPGVSNSVVDTFFACTNTTSANIRVGIEVFNSVGGAVSDPSGTSLDILPGGTRLFGTGAALWVGVHSLVAVGALSKGSARILATESKGIICSAFLADAGNAPPTSMADLKVIKKTKQKGE